MTNRNTLSKSYYSSSPLNTLSTLRRILRTSVLPDDFYSLGFSEFTPYFDPFYPESWFPKLAEKSRVNSMSTEESCQIKGVTKDGEEFHIYTSGDYPRLRIVKNLDENKQLKGIDILASVPGLQESEISVDVLGQEITIEVTPSCKLQEETVILNQIPNRHSKVLIGITGPFEMEKVEGKFEGSGILHLFIPAIEKPKSKKISIGSTKK